jgi:hypothetical protein
MLFVIFAVWLLSTFFESGHDWHLHKKLYKPSASSKDKDTLKAWDGAEKAVFLLGMSIWIYVETGDPMFAGLVTVWQVWLRWIGHEAWYSWFSGTRFGVMGKSSIVDLALWELGLGRWGNVLLMLLPAIALSIILILRMGG